MNQKLAERLVALGAKLAPSEGDSLEKFLETVDLSAPLYPKPVDTPWSRAGETEPVAGLEDYLDSLDGTPSAEELVTYFYAPGHEDRYHGQSYFSPLKFTPFLKGSMDYQEWQGIIEEEVAREAIGSIPMELMLIFRSFGYPDCYFLNLEDTDQRDPRIFSTDHEVYFGEIDDCGRFSEFLQGYYTPGELRDALARFLEK